MAADAVFEMGDESLGSVTITSIESCALLCLNFVSCVAATTTSEEAGMLCNMYSSTVTSSEENMLLKSVGVGKSNVYRFYTQMQDSFETVMDDFHRISYCMSNNSLQF